MRGIAVGVVLFGIAAHGAAGSPSAITVAGDAEIRRFDGSLRAVSEVSDLDSIAARSRVALNGPAWKASLETGARAVLRTELIGSEFRRVLDLAEGTASLCGAWALRASGFLLRSPDATVDVSFQYGVLNVNVSEGGSVHLAGYDATLTLKPGQQLRISFDPGLIAFNIAMIEDAGMPVDIKIGRTTVQVDQGDVLSAYVFGDDLEITITHGQVKVLTPDGNLVTPARGEVLAVPKGGQGAVRGWIVRRRRPGVPEGIPGEPKARPFKDRSDISPS